MQIDLKHVLTSQCVNKQERNHKRNQEKARSVNTNEKTESFKEVFHLPLFILTAVGSNLTESIVSYHTFESEIWQSKMQDRYKFLF